MITATRQIALVDSAILRDLFCGRRVDTLDSSTSVAVSWPEYFSFLRSIAQTGLGPPLELRALSHRAGDTISPADWLAALFDPRRIGELHGRSVHVVVPRAEHAAQVGVAMTAWSLGEREAVNLVLATTESMRFVARSTTVSEAMREALDSLEVPYDVIVSNGDR